MGGAVRVYPSGVRNRDTARWPIAVYHLAPGDGLRHGLAAHPSDLGAARCTFAISSQAAAARALDPRSHFPAIFGYRLAAMPRRGHIVRRRVYTSMFGMPVL